MVRRVLSGNAEQKDRMKMKQSDRQRTPGGQPFAASGNERKKGADFSALTLRMDRIPYGFQGRVRRTEQGRLRRRQIFTEQIHVAAADHVAVGAKTGEVAAHAGGASFLQADIGRLHGTGFQQTAAHGAFQTGSGQQGTGTGGTRGRAFALHHGQQDHGLPFVQQPGRTGLQVQRYAQAIHRGAHQHRRGRRFRHPVHRRLLSHSRSPWWGT